MTDTGWVLHSGRRSFGPLTEDELRAYFRAHMVKADDRIDAPGRDAPLSASEVAAMLGIEGPLPAAPKPYEPPRAPSASGPAISVDRVATGAPVPAQSNALPPPPSARRIASEPVAETGIPWSMVLWILGLLVLHIVLAPRLFPQWAATMPMFPVLSIAVFALVVGGVFGVFHLLARSARARAPRITVALAAFTLAYLAIGANAFLFDTALDPQGRSVGREDSRRAWILDGQQLQKRKDYAALLEHANRFRDVHPDDVMAWDFRGYANTYLGNHAAAVRDNQQVARLRPDDAHSWMNLGLAHLNNNDPTAGADAMRKAVALAPGDAGAWNDLGVCYARLGRVDDAVAAYERAVKLNPRYKMAWANLAGNYERQGLMQKAEAARARATALAR